MVKKLIHIEALIIFVGILFIYGHLNLNWWLFLLFLLAPDLSALGYLFGERIGAYTYNLVHTFLFPALILFFAYIFSIHILLVIGLIWSAHIAMDRTIGYGLKYSDNPKSTHLQKL